MADSDRKSSPNVLFVILALLGLGTLQSLSGPGNDTAAGKAGNGPAEPAKPSTAAATAGAMTDDFETKVLKPLLDHFPVDDPAGVLKSVKESTGRDKARGLQCLIVTVPDPVRSTNSHRFDEWAGAIQRACESENYVLERSRIPWGVGPEPPPPANGWEAVGGGVKVTVSERAGSPAPPEKQPGLFLFRGDGGATTDDGHVPLLAVFLVPETPTLGVNKDVLLAGLRLANEWDVRNRFETAGARVFNIVGPCFSGSKHSLEQTIASWCRKNQDTENQFWVISGAASAIDGLRTPPPGKRPNRVDFRTTIRSHGELLAAVLDYIHDDEDVALLAEANTGFGIKVLNTGGGKGKEKEKAGMSGKPRGKLVFYPFPLNISKLRDSYEKKGLLHDDTETKTLRSAENLTIPFNEAGDAADVPTTRTPGFTAAVEELALNQVFADIGRRKIRRVGIFATDPLDVVFLARKVRQFCPDALLFTTTSHILFTHPQHVAEMRGMLVASTYPLFPQNQLWSYSYRGDSTTLSFAGDTVQGTYNAVIAQLDDATPGHIAGDASAPPQFLEYGAPFDPPPTVVVGGVSYRESTLRKPPVWLCAVGNHGLYPVKVVTAERPGAPGHLFAHRTQRHRADSTPDPAVGWARPEFPTFWTFLFWCLSVACLLLTALNLLVSWWAVSGLGEGDRRGFQSDWAPMVRLAEFLNCRRSRYAARFDPCRGPGPFPAAALSVLLIVYVTATRPLLSVVVRSPWYPPRPDDVSYWLAAVAYAVICLSAAAVVLSTLSWWVVSWRLSRGGLRVSARAAAAAAAVVILSAMFAALVFDPLRLRDRPPEVALLQLARGMAVPSGVSPVLAMVFLGVAGVAWAYAQLKRRYVYDQFTPKGATHAPPAAGDTDEPGELKILREVRRRRDRFEDLMTSPSCVFFRGRSLAPLIVFALAVVYFVLPLPTRFYGPGQGKTYDGRLFDVTASFVFGSLFALLTFHLLQLAMLWANAQGLMKHLVRLPLGAALDRLPTRVAHWFQEAPGPEADRFDLLQRQAMTLAAASERNGSAVLNELRDAGVSIDDAIWVRLVADLKVMQRETFAAVREPIVEILLTYWGTLSIPAAYPEPSGTGGGAPAHPPGAADPASPVKLLPEWAKLTEDLLALMFMRWLAAAMAQVWILIGFLVVGSLSLLMAVNSYPFPYQERLVVGIGLLIGVLAVTVLMIVVGFNRDELISRISNTTPNAMKLNSNLVGGLLTYVVPLVGVLAAFSFETSDTLRSLLDPILRHMR